MWTAWAFPKASEIHSFPHAKEAQRKLIRRASAYERQENFSALGRIDEKYVEEADGYSVAPEARGAEQNCRAAKAFRKERRRLAAGLRSYASGAFIEADGFPCERGEPNKAT
ncbi:MAG: hypothetical protein ACLRSW_02105 [Christensenellaceae bacterium]